VSRSPVAEAVARLAAEGLVQVVPQSGTFVARFSMDEIREGAFLREALELAAVERVAERITEDQLVLLRRNLRLQEVLVEDRDFPGFYQTDSQMHELVLSFTGLRRLAGLSETAWVHVNRARQLILPEPGRVQATLTEHQAIVSALGHPAPPAPVDRLSGAACHRPAGTVRSGLTGQTGASARSSPSDFRSAQTAVGT
jgi:GntR family transcriptional regulator, rspAB operon transcriptional repressor